MIAVTILGFAASTACSFHLERQIRHIHSILIQERKRKLIEEEEERKRQEKLMQLEEERRIQEEEKKKQLQKVCTE